MPRFLGLAVVAIAGAAAALAFTHVGASGLPMMGAALLGVLCLSHMRPVR